MQVESEPPSRIYLPRGSNAEALQRVVGHAFALSAEGVRVWWPGLLADSSPDVHPSVIALDGESLARVLAEFARGFDLSRPCVRAEIRLIEDCSWVLGALPCGVRVKSLPAVEVRGRRSPGQDESCQD
jgi:hypothetical protein